MPTTDLSWIVVSPGPREHYAVARAAFERKLLDRLYTLFWAKRFRGALAALPPPISSLAGFYHPDLKDAQVVSLWPVLRDLPPLVGQRWTSPSAAYESHTKAGRSFGAAVSRHLRGHDSNAAAIFGYSGTMLELLDDLQHRSITTVVDQVDPGAVEHAIVANEREMWPGWEVVSGRPPEMYYARLRAEWDAASIVVVNSEWSRRALIMQGVPTAKLAVIPLVYSGKQVSALEHVSSPKLRVLWLGSVILRKGIQYLLQAAALLRNENIEFSIYGPLGIRPSMWRGQPSNVQFMGKVARLSVAEIYAAHDVFVLPTLSDGFGITQLEAMWHGLPVIATPQCGEVVTDGVDGFIVPPRDAVALAERILSFAQDREMLRCMAVHSRRKAREFTLRRYYDDLTKAVLARMS